MTLESIKDFFKKRSTIEYSIMLVVTIVSFWLMHDRLESKALLTEYASPLTISGEYSVDGGNTFTPYSSYDDIDMKRLNSLTIRGTFDQDVKAGHKIYMFLNYIDATVYVNDKIVYTNDPDVAYCWDALDSVAFGPHDIVTIELNTRRTVVYNVAFKQFLNRLTDSTKNKVLQSMMQKDAVRQMGELMLFVIGILVMQTYFEYQREDREAMGILACGGCIIVGAVSCFINADYITLLLPQFELLEYLDTLTQIYMVIFALAYLRRYMKDEICKAHSGVILVVAYNVTLIYMIWRTFATGAAAMSMVSIALLGVIAIPYFVYLLIHDFRSQKTSLTRSVGIHAAILLVSVLIELIYFLITGTYIVDVLEFGLFAFAICQLVVISRENTRIKQEAARARELENELMRSQIGVMVSQIQPHFMYNALSTIRALVSKDPDEARKAIDFFTKYIRANMDSLSEKECIPFKKEMEHVESYLYIEKLRFGDKLKVDYDIEAEAFGIPAMTIQTLAENSVKHGLLAKEEGGTLLIKSRETANCFEVQIIDDGVGFDTNARQDASRSHVGIENSRKRLAAMCGGTLSIGSKLGVGTTITITIPKQLKRDKDGIIEMS